MYLKKHQALNRLHSGSSWVCRCSKETYWHVFSILMGTLGLHRCRQAQTCDWKLYLCICHKIYILHWIWCLNPYQDGYPMLWALDWLRWGVNGFMSISICLFVPVHVVPLRTFTRFNLTCFTCNSSNYSQPTSLRFLWCCVYVKANTASADSVWQMSFNLTVWQNRTVGPSVRLALLLWIRNTPLVLPGHGMHNDTHVSKAKFICLMSLPVSI